MDSPLPWLMMTPDWTKGQFSGPRNAFFIEASNDSCSFFLSSSLDLKLSCFYKLETRGTLDEAA